MSSETDLPTIWAVADDLWEMVACLLERFDPPKKMGRKRIDARKALEGMIYRGRTGCQWSALPTGTRCPTARATTRRAASSFPNSSRRTGCQWSALPTEFGDDASVHRTQQRWEALGLFDAIWGLVLSRCQELGGVDWRWQSADGCLGKARGVGKKGHRTPAPGRTPRTVVSRASRRGY